jgi:hypothetical protein
LEIKSLENMVANVEQRDSRGGDGQYWWRNMEGVKVMDAGVAGAGGTGG